MANNKRLVGIGEALFDVFPTERKLGGAPLNVAVHAHRLLSGSGGEGVAVSRVGTDALGDEIQIALAGRGMRTDELQRDAAHPTGVVQVTLDARSQPAYEILRGAAWDFLEWNSGLERLAAECTAVCFGSLAQREPVSRAAIRRFLQAAPQAIRLFDVNLRQSFHNPELIRESIALATAMKLNEDEFPALAAGSSPEELRVRCNLDALVLTRGERGTVVFTAKGAYQSTSPVAYPMEPDADAVGAGDACAAGLLSGILLGMSPQESVELADRMGAYVASRHGATPPIPDSVIRP